MKAPELDLLWLEFIARFNLLPPRKQRMMTEILERMAAGEDGDAVAAELLGISAEAWSRLRDDANEQTNGRPTPAH